MSKSKQDELKNWINDQEIAFEICGNRERGFLKRMYGRNQEGKDYTPKQKEILEKLQIKSVSVIQDKKNGIIISGDSRFKALMGDYLEIRTPFAKIPEKTPEKEGEYIWYPYKVNSKGEQSWYFTDKEGTWYITLEQNAIAIESNYESDQQLWSRKDKGLRFRKYKDLDRHIFLEGKDKDYYYMNRGILPPIPSMCFEITLNKKGERGFSGGKPILILTLSGAVKFNFRKRKESALKTADALVERDRDFIREEKLKLLNLKKEYKHKLEEMDERKLIPLEPSIYQEKIERNNEILILELGGRKKEFRWIKDSINIAMKYGYVGEGKFKDKQQNLSFYYKWLDSGIGTELRSFKMDFNQLKNGRLICENCEKVIDNLHFDVHLHHKNSARFFPESIAKIDNTWLLCTKCHNLKKNEL